MKRDLEERCFCRNGYFLLDWDALQNNMGHFKILEFKKGRNGFARKLSGAKIKFLLAVFIGVGRIRIAKNLGA